MVTVSTKEELKAAMDRHEPKILATGSLAESLRKKSKIKKGLRVGGLLLAIGGVIMIPFTAGTSSAITAMGLTAAGLTVGTVTLSVGELVILCGFTLGLFGIIKGATVKFKSDGSVEIEPKYK